MPLHALHDIGFCGQRFLLVVEKSRFESSRLPLLAKSTQMCRERGSHCNFSFKLFSLSLRAVFLIIQSRPLLCYFCLFSNNIRKNIYEFKHRKMVGLILRPVVFKAPTMLVAPRTYPVDKFVMSYVSILTRQFSVKLLDA